MKNIWLRNTPWKRNLFFKKKLGDNINYGKYGILASTKEFMHEYKKNYPNWKEDIEKFKYYFDAPNFNLTVVEKIFNM